MTELICLDKRNSESMITPRFLTCEEMEGKWLPSSSMIFILVFLEPKTIISVLFSFSWRKLFDNHFLISEIHSSNGWMKSPTFSERYNSVSSAYRWKETLCFLIISPRGRIYKLKRSGPKIEPWGTPLIIGADDEENLPSSTEKDLSLR